MSGRPISPWVETMAHLHGCCSFIKSEPTTPSFGGQSPYDPLWVQQATSGVCVGCCFHSCLLQGLRLRNNSHHLTEAEIDKSLPASSIQLSLGWCKYSSALLAVPCSCFRQFLAIWWLGQRRDRFLELSTLPSFLMSLQYSLKLCIYSLDFVCSHKLAKLVYFFWQFFPVFLRILYIQDQDPVICKER